MIFWYIQNRMFIFYFINIFVIIVSGDINMNISIRDRFKKGFLDLIILSILDDGDLYGYELRKKISDRCDGYLSVPEGSLYPTLYKLEDKGMISSEKRQEGKRMMKVFYHIEQPGRDYLEELTEEFYGTVRAIQEIVEYAEGKKDGGK